MALLLLFIEPVIFASKWPVPVQLDDDNKTVVGYYCPNSVRIDRQNRI